MLPFAVRDYYFGDDVGPSVGPELTIDDITEMIDIYNYFRLTEYSLTHEDLAFMFNCSLNNVKKAMRGTHPAQTEARAQRRESRLWEQRATPEFTGPARGRPMKTHCSAGHALTDDNLYINKYGAITRDCLTCHKAARINKYKRKKEQ